MIVNTSVRHVIKVLRPQTKYLKHRKSEHPSLLLIDHQPDVNHDLPDPSPPNIPPLPESDSDEPISPTKRKANGFDRGDNEPSDKIPKPVKRKAMGMIKRDSNSMIQK